MTQRLKNPRGRERDKRAENGILEKQRDENMQKRVRARFWTVIDAAISREEKNKKGEGVREEAYQTLLQRRKTKKIKKPHIPVLLPQLRGEREEIEKKKRKKNEKGGECVKYRREYAAPLFLRKEVEAAQNPVSKKRGGEEKKKKRGKKECFAKTKVLQQP